MAKDLNAMLHDPRILRILQALEGLEYGSIQITVHDSEIAQIERTEKFRFPLETGKRAKDTSTPSRNK